MNPQRRDRGGAPARMIRRRPAIDARTAALLLGKALTAGARTGVCPGVSGGVVRGALEALARTLAASSTPEHRALAPMLVCALEDGDRGAALALVRTAAHRADRRAEKIVSRRYRFVWICNPKAASRSLIAALGAADPGAQLIRRRTLEEIHARHPETRTFFSFAFLRHPVARTRSFHADKHTLARRDADARRWFIEPYHGLRPGMSFAEFCRWLDTPCGSDAFADRHWLSQSRQVADDDGRLPDFLGRHERLEEDWRTVCARLGLSPAPLPRLNASGPHAPGAADSGPAGPGAGSAAPLRRRYAGDFALGGYGDAP